jgi:lipopolysaccharide assembly outer membrane protein LptD (OstA)
MRPAFTAILLLLCLGFAWTAKAQLPLPPPQQQWEIEALTTNGSVIYSRTTGTVVGTNGVLVKYGNAVMVADTVSVNQGSGEAIADGGVRIQSDNMVWAGEHITYNFKTHQMRSEQFRAGKAPFYAGGEKIAGDVTNKLFTATNAFITLEDYSSPLMTVHAHRLVIRPGDCFEAHGATLCVGGVPVFYFPYYSQKLDTDKPAFTATPGYRSRYGAFLLGSYTWNWDETVESKLHMDYRTKRGPGVGPDVNLHLGDWGDATVRYYYLYDYEPETNSFGATMPHNRQRVEFNWFAQPFTNTTFKSHVSYQSDDDLRREFFESEYRANVQPSTFVEARHFWDNWSLSTIASPRVNDFYEAVERLPEIKLTGYRQQIADLPFYYESESRAGYLRRLFAETNGITGGANYEATRADTFHQLVLPTMLFGWLSVTPRAGGRLTYYGEADGPGATTQETTRSVFNTGAEATFKLSRTWAGVQGGLFDLDGVRHIIEPSANYVYVPQPSALPPELPQFDSLLPSLHLLPIDFPDNNAIDSVDSQNVIRWGLRNRIQTKRDGQVEDVLDWNLFTDWRLRPDSTQNDFSDIWSDVRFRPRSWLTLQSMTRFSPEDGQFRLAFSSLTLEPNTVWNWRLGHLYLRDYFNPADPTAWGQGNDVLSSSFYFRLNENWGLRATHYYDLVRNQLTEQAYSVYRDFRSWTGGLSFRVRQNSDGKEEYAVYFTYSIKALPHQAVGADTIHTDALFNY